MLIKVTKTAWCFLLAIGLTVLGEQQVQAQIITTVAGNGGQGYIGDGVAATSTQLNLPQGVAVDSSGTIYIADTWNNRIRKVDPLTGIISTYAGSISGGYAGDGGPATNARLDHPIGITVDDSGNVYFTDNSNNCIRRVTKSTGIITTIAGIAGGGGYSGDGGPATAALLGSPFGIHFDKHGNLFIADETNSRIREITIATGIINTIAGIGTNGFSGDGGPATAAQFFFPTDVIIDTAGTIYVSDAPLNNRVRIIDAKTDTITTIVGNGGTDTIGNGGPGTDAEFNSPAYLALDDSGNLYISDLLNAEVRKYTVSTGIVSAFAGNFTWGFYGDGGPATDANLNEPSGLAVDICGNLFICERGNCRVRKVTIPRPVVTTAIKATTSATICPGKTVSFTDSSNFNALSWQWHFSGGKPNSSSAKNPVIEYDTLGTFAVSVIAYNLCDNATDTLVKYITVTSNFPVTIQPPSSAICTGQSITLVADTTGDKYTWAPAVGLSATTGDSVIASPSADVTYTVTGIDSLGCSASGSAVISVKSGPNKPQITVSVTGDTLFSSAANGNQWFVNGQLKSGAVDSLFVITGLPGNDTITVVVTNVANGCSATSDAFVTGINQLSVNSNHLSIYPNPTSGGIMITISSSVAEVKDWNLQVANVLGQTLYTSQLVNYKNEINLSHLPDGVYFITVITKTARTVISVVKQN